MGNRAVITTRKYLEDNTKAIGIYLHWNGGRDSVEAFLKYCEIKGYRYPESDSYGWARLCQVISNFFGGSTSVGLGTCNNLDCDNYDNGVYIIEKWQIVGRAFMQGNEQMEYDFLEMLIGIDEKQPTGEQLGETAIKEYLNNKNDEIKGI
jgi:hypothetical protein